MASGVAVMSMRQGTTKDTQVLKVGGELFDQEGYRVDVTVWFRHRNEALYYIDSGGNLHGPLDLKHSSKLDGMKKSSDSYVKRSWMEGQRSQSSTRSETNYHAYDESKGHVNTEIDGLLDDLNRMRHHENANSRMTRWSSLGTVRGDAGRYSTTLTRRHMKRNREPIDVFLNKPLTSNLSKVDILSVDNRSGRRGSLSTDNEKRLMDELIETRRELQRTRSMMSVDGKRGPNFGSTLKVPVNNISSQQWKPFLDGKSESHTSSARLNPVDQNPGYSFHPRGTVRETSLRVDSGQDGSTEWSRREENIRETGEIQKSHTSYLQGEDRFVHSPAPLLQSAPSVALNGFSSHPPFSTTNTPSASSDLRIIRKPTLVTKNGDSEIITTEEMKKEDDASETIIQRRTIRRKRVPSSRMTSRYGDTSEEIQRSTSYNMHRRNINDANYAFEKPPPSVRTRLQTDIGEYGPRTHLIRRYHSGAPPRTYSQTNLNQYSNTLRNEWSSENNLRVGSYLKQVPIHGTYSAHQENIRRRNELNHHSEHLRSSRRMSETGYAEICHEIVSLLPIGRGIQDLESGSNAATLPRANSQTVVDVLSTTSKYSIGSNAQRPPPLTTVVVSPTSASASSTLSPKEVRLRNQRITSQMNLRNPLSPSSMTVFSPRGRSYSAGVGNRGQYYSGTQSPAPSRQHGGRVVSEHRYRTVQNESHWSNFNGLGSSTGSLHGGSYTAGQGQTNHMALDAIDNQHTLSNDMSFHWFRPNTTQQEATQLLINKESGRFIVRTSKSQPDCYSLVVRVPISADDSEPVRTFLLDRVKGGDAVHLRGFESEPIFPSLTAFVQSHTIHQGALPVLLKMPMRSALSSSYLAGGTVSPSLARYGTSGTDFLIDVLYLGSVDVFPLQGESAVKRAVEQILSQANNPQKGLKKKCEASVMCSANKGITIADKNSTRFTKKSIPANRILYCSYDPEERVFNAIELKNRGVADSQIFAIVVKKTRFKMTEHAVYVMCQLEPHQPSSNLINFINQNLPVHYR